MDYKSLETKTLQRQGQYIRELEKQLEVYGQKDKAQEALIEKMDQALQIFAAEISRLKEKEEKSDRERT